MERIDMIEKKLIEIESRISKLEDVNKSIKKTQISVPSEDQNLPSIAISPQMIDKITKLDEVKQFPVLWFYSSKPMMTVKEFLDATSKKGFVLSHVWLPSVGGHFLTKMVKTGILHEVKEFGKNKERFWRLTDVGKIKINKMINELNNIQEFT